MNEELSKKFAAWKAEKEQVTQDTPSEQGKQATSAQPEKRSPEVSSGVGQQEKKEPEPEQKKGKHKETKEEKKRRKQEEQEAKKRKKEDVRIRKAKEAASKPKRIKKDVFKALKKRKRYDVAKRKQLRFFLNRAGYEDVDDIKLKKIVLYRIPLIICSILSVITLLLGLFSDRVPLLYALFFILVGIWIAGYLVILIIEFLGIYLYLDNRTYHRKKELESVLADFLQLTSSNISAGMPIDKALWFAVRPKFGVLAKEIEEVAKATLTGEDLSKALKNFTEKYDSVILSRSINLLLEGMQGGGEIAELLNKIALNIQQVRIMKKQMAADVLTYVIFITFASVVIAPFLFALSTQLLDIVIDIMGTVGSGGALSAFASSFSGETTIDPSDFRYFVLMMLVISSTISAMIIGIIQKGSAREGVKKIPYFVGVSLGLFYLGKWILGMVMGSLV